MEYIITYHNIINEFNCIREIFEAKIWVDSCWTDVTDKIWSEYVEEKGEEFFKGLLI